MLWVMANVLTISDLHAPFHHKDAIPFLLYLKKHFKCDRIVCMGDEADFHGLSKFPKDPDGYSAGHEFQEARLFLQELFGHFPVVQSCTSNHTSRPFRKAYEAGIPEEMILSYEKFFKAPDGWQWADKFVIDNVDYIHGEGYTGQMAASKAAIQRRRSTVIGHIHTFGGVQYMEGANDRIFGMNTGCLIDVERYAFAYGKKLANKPTIGTGVVINGIHAFYIPLHEEKL